MIFTIFFGKEGVGQSIDYNYCRSKAADVTYNDILLKLKQMDIQLSTYKEMVEKMEVRLKQYEEITVETEMNNTKGLYDSAYMYLLLVFCV